MGAPNNGEFAQFEHFVKIPDDMDASGFGLAVTALGVNVTAKTLDGETIYILNSFDFAKNEMKEELRRVFTEFGLEINQEESDNLRAYERALDENRDVGEQVVTAIAKAQFTREEVLTFLKSKNTN